MRGKKIGEKSYINNALLNPDSVEERTYQKTILNIVRTKNTLVVLPTALGKTVIALLLAIEQIKNGKVYFLAPTRPLVQQHHINFLEKTLLDKDQLVLVTGVDPPQKRGHLYREGEIFFATPQCVRNDLKKGLVTFQDCSLLIFDEAHRAYGKYAYVEIAEHYIKQSARPLILGLTASPGGQIEKITKICQNLSIERIEYRTDEDEDVKPYIHPIHVEWNKVKLPEMYLRCRDKFREMVNEKIVKLQSSGVLRGKNPKYISRANLIELNQDLQNKLGEGGAKHLYRLKSEVTSVISLTHMKELIESQGAETLNAFIKGSFTRMLYNGSKGHYLISRDPKFIQIIQIVNDCLNVQNPKIMELLKVITNQIETNKESRFIVFTQYRDTVNFLLEVFDKVPLVIAQRFVGQSKREEDPGMTQEEQKETLSRLRKGEINVLVATSIAEEGLDIPEVDHVVFYEPVSSGIRYIQRRGRTGRKVAGKVTILIAEKTIDEAYYWASLKRAEKMKRLIKQVNLKLFKNRKNVTFDRKITEWGSSKITKKDGEIVGKNSSQALKYLIENLPEKLIILEAFVKQVEKETCIKRSIIERAVKELIHEGKLYQPRPNMIIKI